MRSFHAFICIVVSFMIASKALATVSEAQEKHADQICNADPTLCGLYPETH